MIFYFSATGNSKYIATSLAQRLGETSLTDITTLLRCPQDSFVPKPELGHDAAVTSIGFVFPIYGWSVPNIVRIFIKQMKMQPNSNPYVYFVVTCGDDIGIADQHIVQALAEIGLTVSAGYSIVMPDSYICLPGFDVDKDNERRAKFNALDARLDHIAAEIRQRRAVIDVKHGAFPKLKTNVLGALFRKYLVTDKYFHRTDACIKCGKCAEICPMQNITLTDTVEWHSRCTGCLACYHHCPTRAIRFGRFTNHKGQYLLSRHRSEISAQ